MHSGDYPYRDVEQSSFTGRSGTAALILFSTSGGHRFFEFLDIKKHEINKTGEFQRATWQASWARIRVGMAEDYVSQLIHMHVCLMKVQSGESTRALILNHLTT